MKIINQVNKYYNLCLALSGSMEVYHVGSKLYGGNFDFSYLGTGEGMGALGPGIYFSDNKNLAKLYAKYHKRPYLYKAIIQADKLLNMVTGEPRHLSDKVNQIRAQLQDLLPDKRDCSHCRGTGNYYQIKCHDCDGTGKVKNVRQMYDLFPMFNKYTVKDNQEENNVARKLLSDNGIGGFYITLPGGPLEICVFDLSIISVVETIPLLGTQEEYDEQEHQDLITSSKCYWCKETMWDPSTAIDTKEDRIRRYNLEKEHKAVCTS